MHNVGGSGFGKGACYAEYALYVGCGSGAARQVGGEREESLLTDDQTG